MKILLADKFPENYKNELINAGNEVTSNPDLQAEDLPNAIKGYDVLVVRSTKVNADTFEAADNLKMVIRAGAGTNTIDVKTAAEKNIYVCNTPGKNALAVAELAFALLLSIDRNIPDNVMEMRNNNWDKKRFSKAQGIYGRNLGIIGFGQIGFALAERAKAFGMNVFVFDVVKPNYEGTLKTRFDALNITYVDTIYDIAKQCDVISLHVPANEHTKNMVNKEFLDQVKPNTIIINTSRGAIVNDEDLITAMNEKNVRAGLDVYNNEPASGKDNISTPLSQHKNVYGTHHIGASTAQAQAAVAEEVVNVVTDLHNGTVRNCVNMNLMKVTT